MSPHSIERLVGDLDQCGKLRPASLFLQRLLPSNISIKLYFMKTMFNGRVFSDQNSSTVFVGLLFEHASQSVVLAWQHLMLQFCYPYHKKAEFRFRENAL